MLDNGEMALVKDFDINSHSALVEKMEASDVFAGELSATQVQNLANYFVSLPSEVAMKLWTVMGNGNVENTVALHQAATDSGKSVSAHLVEILTGTE